jgi:hypothetical protein
MQIPGIWELNKLTKTKLEDIRNFDNFRDFHTHDNFLLIETMNDSRDGELQRGFMFSLSLLNGNWSKHMIKKF